MKKLFLVTIFWVSVANPAGAEWTNISSGLDDANIQSVTADVRNPKIIYAASGGHLYKSEDEGGAWRRVLSLRGDAARINFILIDPLDSRQIYVATDKGVRLSRESGKKWEVFFNGVGNESKESLCLAAGSGDPEVIYVGTAQGLFSVNKKTRAAKRISGLPRERVLSILIQEGEDFEGVAATEKGIYRNKKGLDFWERVYVNPEAKAAQGETALEQFDIEEVFTRPFFANVIFFGAQNRFYAGTRDGILEAAGDAGSWLSKDGQNLPDKKVNAVTCSADSLYTATDQGVFRSDPKSHSFTALNEGLESKEINHIFYNPGGDYLAAATKKGVYKYIYPELNIEAVSPHSREKSVKAGEILKLFHNEPTIFEVQETATRYAEVHPSKIEEWRKAAAMKAWLPALSVDTGVSADENIDLDRGGTNDPDRFISGPQEKSYDWSIGLNWDLGDLVWNNDQTSIDTRSRLMVELRDDVLNEVTHLYYERRRLQVEMALSSTKEIPVQIEKQIRLEELTAGIDALTGGYFSKHLGKNPPSRS